jgi:hypothetical protein
MALNHNSFINGGAVAIKLAVLLDGFEPVVFAILGAVHFNLGHIVAPIVAGVLSLAELVELIDDILEIHTESTE